MAIVSDPILARQLAKHRLASIEITVREVRGKLTVHAGAIPASYHPKVAERREAEFAKMGGSMSITQAQAITEKTLERVAGFSAPGLDLALRGLIDILERGDA